MDTSEETTGAAPIGRVGPRPVGTLRGAGSADVTRVGRVVLALVLVTLVVVGAVLLVAGYRKNTQIEDLRAHGVPVRVTVRHCLGLMGGSGSNTAGYECTGTYRTSGTQLRRGHPRFQLLPRRRHGRRGGAVRRSGAAVDAGDGGVVAHHGDALPGGCRTARGGGRRRGVVGTAPPPPPDQRLTPDPTWWVRAVTALPWRMADDPDKPSLSERFTRGGHQGRHGRGTTRAYPETVDGFEEAIARADDKERLIGLIAAPVAGGIASWWPELRPKARPRRHRRSPRSWPRPPGPGGRHAGLAPGSASASTSGSPWPLRPVDLQPALLGLRHPVPALRVVVPGARLPAPAEAEAGQGRRRLAAAPRRRQHRTRARPSKRYTPP